MDRPQPPLIQTVVDQAISTAAKTPTHYIHDLTSSIECRLLSQCSGAEIDIYCQWVVMVVSQSLKPSIQGQRRINAAINNLANLTLPDQKVQIGWTVEHALRNQGVHASGYEHLALEVLLTEVFPERYAARVLHEMAIAYAGPEDILPHFGQLVHQVHSSNGLFVNTDFAMLVEDYIMLDPWNRSRKQSFRKVAVPSPKVIAEVLQSLAEVSDGRQKQMIITGGPIVAWFAAVGEWLLDLKVAIYDSNGVRLSANHSIQSSQLLLTYTADPGITSQTGPWSQDSEQVKRIVSGLPSAESTSLSQTQFGGRLVYNSILVKVFGTSFRHLDREESKAFGTTIGTCACILEDIAKNHVPPTATKRSIACYGQGLLDTLCNFLPELRHLQGRMERQLKLTPAAAGQIYTEQIQHFKAICGCSICCPSANAEDREPGLEGYCLPSLTETIIALGLFLSNIVVASAMFPTRFGLQSYYMQQAEKRLHATVNEISGPDLFKMLYYDIPDTKRLAQAAEIFSGSLPVKDLPPNLVALAHEGVCVALVKKIQNNDSDDGLICVSSGGVCVRQKIFSRACLGPVEVEDELEEVWEEVKCSHLDKSLWLK